MPIKWYKLEDLVIRNFDDINDVPGVYFVRWSKNKEPVSIPRLGGIDKKGILYIGSAKKLRKRLRKLWLGINRKGRHTIGKTIIFCEVFKIINKSNYEIVWHELETPEVAAGQEWAALVDYSQKYKEPPPLNLSLRREMFALVGIAIIGKSRVVYESDEFVRSLIG